MNKVWIASLAIAGLILTGCEKKPPKDLPPPPMGTQGATAMDNGAGNPGAPVPGSRADFLATVASDRVFFALDKSDVDDSGRATLDSQAKWLAHYPQVHVTIEGHCDERGTREYNLALGARRANAAKNYLAAAGVAVGRINTISYGKERPDALGSNEEAWAKNRRAVTVTLN